MRTLITVILLVLVYKYAVGSLIVWALTSSKLKKKIIAGKKLQIVMTTSNDDKQIKNMQFI